MDYDKNFSAIKTQVQKLNLLILKLDLTQILQDCFPSGYGLIIINESNDIVLASKHARELFDLDSLKGINFNDLNKDNVNIVSGDKYDTNGTTTFKIFLCSKINKTKSTD